MQPQILVVSDPPHGSVDIPAVADMLGISEHDAGLKMAFGAPEVLMATDSAPAHELATRLRTAGVTARILDGAALEELPWPTPALSCSFGKDGLIAETPSGVVSVSWSEPVFGVYCRPPAEFNPPELPPPPGPDELSGVKAAEASQWGAVLDLYLERNGSHQRLLVSEALTEISGSDGLSAGDQVEEVAGQCRERFEQLSLDVRFDGVRPRQRFRMGDESFDLDLRKLFSYGTLLLQQVLASVSPELGGLTQYEYASRLVHALSHVAE